MAGSVDNLETKRGETEKGFYIRQVGSSEFAGPMSHANLIKAIKSGGVHGSDSVRRSDSKNWHRVDSVSELKKLIGSPGVEEKTKLKKYSARSIILTIVAIWIGIIFISSIVVVISRIDGSTKVAQENDKPSGPRVEHLVEQVRKHAGPRFNYLESKLDNKIDISLTSGKDGVVCKKIGEEEYSFSIRVYFQMKNYVANKSVGVATWNEVVPKRINMHFLVFSTPEQNIPKMLLVSDLCAKDVVRHHNYIASQWGLYQKYVNEQAELSGMGLVQSPKLEEQLDARSDYFEVKSSVDGFYEFINLVLKHPYWHGVNFDDWEL